MTMFLQELSLFTLFFYNKDEYNIIEWFLIENLEDNVVYKDVKYDLIERFLIIDL